MDLVNSIEQRLSYLVTRIQARGAVNLLDAHVHSENFYLHFLNRLFGLDLKNINAVAQNSPGLDLVDTTNKVVVQVSATATKQKLEAALKRVPIPYHGYSFLFIPVVADSKNLGKSAISNPHGMKFTPGEDIFDVKRILRKILPLDVDQIRGLASVLEKELRFPFATDQMESILATLINLLAEEDWSRVDTRSNSLPFDIDQKIDFNDLHDSREIIHDYKVYHPRLNSIYTEHTRMGSNKTLQVTMKIRSFYQAALHAPNSDARFAEVIQAVVGFVRAAENFKPIAEEGLEICAKILVVDAFIRCKIFKKPPQVLDAHT